MWFGWSGLGGIWGFEGLDNMDLLEFLRGGVRKKDPGLNLLDSIWLIQVAEAAAEKGLFGATSKSPGAKAP
jgi:hypothetical protein